MQRWLLIAAGPAAVDNAVGLISTGYLKDTTDHQWDKTPA
jgi:hypothetical protein